MATINETAQNRDKRALETREREARPLQWRPANALPSPEPQDGYTFHWKRKSMMGQDDPGNMARARREGWIVCMIKDHPEFADDFAAFGAESSNGIIEMGGLVLCKIPVELAVSRKEYYSDHTQRETESVNNNFMREQDRRMPLFNESSSRTQFRK